MNVTCVGYWMALLLLFQGGPPDTEKSSAGRMSAAQAAASFRVPDGFPRLGLRRRAGRPEPDRDGLGRTRAALGRRELHVRGSDPEIRPAASAIAC